MFGLRITLRCWRDDLAMRTDEPEVAQATEDILVRDFIRTRRVDPDGREGPVAALGMPFMKLKAGDRARGVSLWEKRPQDRDIQDPDLVFPGVVWLTGRGYRKEGDADDAYAEFARLGPDRLRPTPDDYGLLYAAAYQAGLDRLRDDLLRALNELLEDAQGEPGVLHVAVVESVELGVAIVVLDNAEYRILVLPMLDANRKPVPQVIHELLIRVAFDGRRLDELEYPEADFLAQVGYRPGPFDLLLADFRERRR